MPGAFTDESQRTRVQMRAEALSTDHRPSTSLEKRRPRSAGAPKGSSTRSPPSGHRSATS
eukprot:365303-Chlamydomonas_euryale.AAC.27